MRRADIEKLVDARVEALTRQIPGAIGDALRTYGDKPAGEKGALALRFGMVTGVREEDADVLLDDQPTVAIPAGFVGNPPAEGDRVGVFFSPPGGATIFGGGNGPSVATSRGEDNFLALTPTAVGQTQTNIPILPVPPPFDVAFPPNSGSLVDTTTPQVGALCTITGSLFFSAFIACSSTLDSEAHLEALVIDVGSGLAKAFDEDFIIVPSVIAFGSLTAKITLAWDAAPGDLLIIRGNLANIGDSGQMQLSGHSLALIDET